MKKSSFISALGIGILSIGMAFASLLTQWDKSAKTPHRF